MKTPFRVAVTIAGDICLLHDDGRLYYGLGEDNETPEAIGPRCKKEVAVISDRWYPPKEQEENNMKENNMSKTCQNCAYGQVSREDKKKIECHYYAPRILHGSGAGWSDTKWPLMNYADWCSCLRRKTNV